MSETPCEFEGCDRPASAKGLCFTHYDQRHRRGQELTPIKVQGRSETGLCTFDGCGRKHYGKGLCEGHLAQRRKGKELTPLRSFEKGVTRICVFPDCGRQRHKGEHCGPHALQLDRGRELKPIRTERAHRTVTKDGYVKVYRPDHPNAQKAGWIPEHVLVMSEHLGRPLLPHEEVHHRHGVRDDNRIEQLELWSTSQPKGQRAIDKIEWAREIIALYEGAPL